MFCIPHCSFSMVPEILIDNTRHFFVARTNSHYLLTMDSKRWCKLSIHVFIVLSNAAGNKTATYKMIVHASTFMGSE